MGKKQYRKPKYPNMTIRQRLNISNLLMIVIPLVIAGMTSIMSILFAYAYTRETQKLATMDNENIIETCQKYVDSFEAVLLYPTSDAAKETVSKIEEDLISNNVRVRILENEEEVYAFGRSASVDKNLINASQFIGENGYISSGNRQLYLKNVTVNGSTYEISILIDKMSKPYQGFRFFLIIAVVVFILTIIVAVYFTNKFLTQFVYHRIEDPLDILSDGVHEIREGNLDYQITYDVNDEFKSVTEDFNEMSKALKETTEENIRQEENRKALLASISHDLRSPLTAISGYADGLLDGIASTEEAKEHYLLQIKSRATEMIHMVTRLFMFSKMDLDEYPVFPEQILLNKEVEELILALKPEYEEEGFYLVLEDLVESPIYMDPDLLHTIMTNIIDNSKKYMDKEEGHLYVSVNEEREYFVLHLKDDGPGVEEEALSKLFDVFYRTDPSRKNVHNGSGLGLAIVSKSVRRMHGQVEARNGSDGGLEIIIRLPEEQ